jgi:hypothetical protein
MTTTNANDNVKTVPPLRRACASQKIISRSTDRPAGSRSIRSPPANSTTIVRSGRMSTHWRRGRPPPAARSPTVVAAGAKPCWIPAACVPSPVEGASLPSFSMGGAAAAAARRDLPQQASAPLRLPPLLPTPYI